MVNVINIETGDILATFDSMDLAKRMVSRINRSTGKRLVTAKEA